MSELSFREKHINKNLPMLALLVGAAVVASIYISSPAQYQVFILITFIFILLSICAFINAAIPVYLIIFISPLAGLFSRFENSQAGFSALSLSALPWLFISSVCLLLLLLQINKIRIPKLFLPFLGFSAWILIRVLITANIGLGIKDFLFYSIPFLFGIYTFWAMTAGPRDLTRKIKNAFFSTSVIPIVIYLVFFPAGLVSMTVIGPDGLFAPRPISLYLLVVEALALAEWRYGKQSYKQIALVVTLFCMGIIFFTVSRMASLVSVALFVLFLVKPVRIDRLIIFGLLSLVLVAVMLSIPQVRSRFFYEDSQVTSISLQGVKTSGRSAFWPATLNHAMQNPIIGWGPGSARILVAGLFQDRTLAEYHPHNEYLQVLHDSGIVGLALLLYAWINALLGYWKQWKWNHYKRNPVLAKWNMAATFAILAILLTSITANTLHYPFVTAPVFVILAVASFKNSRESQNLCMNETPSPA